MVFKPKLSQKEVKELASKYRRVLNEAGYHIDKLFLFGSYAKRQIHDWSDVDFLVVSSKFDSSDGFDERVHVNVLGKRLSPLIEAHIASSKEFRHPQSPWLKEAVKYGQEII